MKFTTKQTTQYKCKFVVVPTNLHFQLARWLIEFSLDNITTLKLDFFDIYNSLVDFVYR